MRRPLVPITAFVALAGVNACILPDRDIVLSGEYNASPVRIVEPTYLSRSARNGVCERVRAKGSCQRQLSLAPLPHHLSPDSFPFCRCTQSDRQDPGRLPALRILVEEADGDPLYAALLLDSPASQKDPAFWEYFSAVADPSLQRGGRPSLPPDPSLFWVSEHRAGGTLKEIVLGGAQGLDLCNAHPRIRIQSGWHTLTVLVSDRPWFQPEEQEGPAYAIPDIALGATFARTQYSFYCDTETPDDATSCSCTPKSAAG